MNKESISSKQDAQQRAEQIRYFQAELKELANEDILSLEKPQLEFINNYHKTVLASLHVEHDIDISTTDIQLSLGMKIASFLAALGLSASIFFLFFNFWGGYTTEVQVAILIVTPMILLSLTFWLSKLETTSYYSKIAGLLSFSAFMLNLFMIGQIFNITPTPNAFFVWAVFATLLAYAIDARMLLGMGIISFSMFLSAKFGTWSGMYWIGFGERPENFLPVAFILFGISFIPHTKFWGFGSIYRVFAMILFFIPVLILGNWGYISYLEMDNKSIEMLYQSLGFIFSAIAIYIGIKQNLKEVTTTANIFFTIFLYTKFYDWWWEIMPKYLFFLLVGLSAVLILMVLKRYKRSSNEAL